MLNFVQNFLNNVTTVKKLSGRRDGGRLKGKSDGRSSRVGLQFHDWSNLLSAV